MRAWSLGLVGLLCGVVVWPLLLQGAIFEMHNADVIVGAVSVPLSIELAIGGVLHVPLKDIVAIEGERFAFTDGTTLKGRLTTDTLAVITKYGDVRVPVAQIKTVRVEKDAAAVRPTQGSVFELHSGDVIVGEPGEPLKLAVVALEGTLEVPATALVSFAEERFTLQDGTAFKGRLAQETLTVKTQFGVLQFPSTALKAIRIVQGAASGGTPATTERPPQTGPGATPPGTPAATGNTWRNSLGMEFVLVPAGQFMMGADKGDDDEKPVHAVRLSKPFYLGQYEVTQGQWQAVMGSNPSRFRGNPNLPVEQVTWEDVQAFMRKLNARESGTPYRLPTEAEWEYAARAGTTTDYSFGDDPRLLGEYAWYAENAERKTHPVGQKKANTWGLYDMHGNVWEWVQDWYSKPYPSGSVTDPQGPASGAVRVYRGGSWITHARNCRVSYRNDQAPGGRVVYVGFRLLRTAE
jgi:formylglycine-generating enzyme required for sulfatase activity